MSSTSFPTTESAPPREGAFWPVAVIIAYLAMIAMNGLANWLPLFGRSTGEVSNRYDSLFTPAPYTFSVWGLIYLLLAGFVVYQALPRARTDARVARARPLFVLSCLFNIAWLVSWHALAIAVSELLMLGLLLTLIALYVRIGTWREATASWQRWVLDVPIAVYLGWISVATIANTSIFLLDLGVDAGGAAVAITIAMIAAAALLGLLGLLTRRDWAYALVIAWGLGGISAAQSGQTAAISTAALVGAALLAVLALVAAATQARVATVTHT